MCLAPPLTPCVLFQTLNPLTQDVDSTSKSSKLKADRIGIIDFHELMLVVATARGTSGKYCGASRLSYML